MKKHFALLCFFLLIASCKNSFKSDGDGKKNGSDAPNNTKHTYSLTSLKIQEEMPLGSIAENMSFYVPESVGTQVEVVFQTEPKGIKVTCEPELKDGKISLTGIKTNLKIMLGEAKDVVYNAVIKKYSTLDKLIDVLLIDGGKIKGKPSASTKEEGDAILRGDDPTIELDGCQASITVASKTHTWTHLILNGNEEKFAPVPQYKFTSAGNPLLKLSTKGEEVPAILIVESENAISRGKFKIKRKNSTVDVPVENLIIAGEDVLVDSKVAQKLQKEPIPQFEGGEPTGVELQCYEDAIEEVKIEGEKVAVQKKKVGDVDVWYAKKDIADVAPSGKNVEIVITPKDKESYHAITWKFHIKYTPKTKLLYDYIINGVPFYSMPDEFREGLKKDKNPLIQLHSDHLNFTIKSSVELEWAEVNGVKIPASEIIETATNFIFHYSLPIGSSETQVNITLEPEEKGRYLTRQIQFRAIGDGTKEKISPVLSINDIKDFNKENFLDKLSDGSSPLHKIHEEKATVSVKLSEYQWTFFCDKVKINDKDIKLEKKIENSVRVFYVAKEEFNLNTTDATPVKIEFVPKNEELASGLIWQFKLQAGGEKPALPKDMVQVIRINGIGREGSAPLPNSFLDNLTNGTCPPYVVDGKKAKIEVQWLGKRPSNINEVANKAIFIKMSEDGSREIERQEVQAKKIDNLLHGVEHTYSLPDTTKYLIKIEIIPISEKYKPLVYSFILSDSGVLPEIPLRFGFAGRIAKPGMKATVDAEWTEFFLEDEEGLADSCTIDGHVVEIKKVKTSSGSYFYKAKKALDLPLDSEKEFIFSVNPKDASKYRITTCSYTLKGKSAGDDNAEFVNKGKPNKFKAKVSNKIEWKAGLTPPEYTNEYGSIATTITAYTVSARATVKYKKVRPIDNTDLPGEVEHEMTRNSGGEHTIRIELNEDKPTCIKLFVVAPNGTVGKTTKSVWTYVYNPLPMRWDYITHAEGKEFPMSHRAYDEITIKASDVKENKIYVVFFPWVQTGKKPYTPDGSALPAYQENFTLLNTSDTRQYWQTVVNVKDLLDGSVQSLDIFFPLRVEGVECFKYKVVIKKE